MSKIINEIRNITANKVAERQKQAEEAYPSIIKKIKIAAANGNSEVILRENEVDKYTKKLLESDGFVVWLIDTPPSPYEEYNNMLQRINSKSWQIKW